MAWCIPEPLRGVLEGGAGSALQRRIRPPTGGTISIGTALERSAGAAATGQDGTLSEASSVCEAAVVLTFYQISIAPISLTALPSGAAAAVLRAQHGGEISRMLADLPGTERRVLRAEDATLLTWDEAGVYVADGQLYQVRRLETPAPLTELGRLDWSDGSRRFISAIGPGVLAVRPMDALEAEGMVRLDGLLTGAVIDMRYTTADNFTGVQLYPDDAGCYLLPPSAAALIQANHALSAAGRSLLVYDCYRPLSVQEQMWAVFPQPGFVARPSATGSVHNRGAAVDVGLVDGTGQPVVLPTAHDDFSPLAASDASELPPEAIHNRTLLQAAMRAAGFSTIRSEWWHFNGPGGAPLALDRPFPD